VSATGRILVGTCNWADHEHFYPPRLPAGERLRHYARFFPLVEVDTTFYGIAKPQVAARWAELTPRNFKFNVKAYRSLTMHERENGKPREATRDEEHDFMALLEPLRDAGKLRAVHYQFPPWFQATPPNMDYVARLVERHPDDQVVVEFRHRSWAEPERFDQVTELLQEAGMTYCIVDQPQLGSGSMPPHIAVTSHNLAVVRFHGQNKRRWYVKGATKSSDRFDYFYTAEELKEWAADARRLAREAAEVHILFNNNRSNYAVVNGLQMAELLELDYPSPEEAVIREEHRQEALPL